jgi:hypothetical protein
MKTSLILSSDEFFHDVISEALQKRKLETYPQVKTYLVDLMKFYMDARNLHEQTFDESGKKKPQTLAEIYLEAQNAEHATKLEMLKKLGDRTLYVSGFFSESFSRKVIDVDYYVEMGEVAYGQLSSCTKQDTLSRIYSLFSNRFIEFVDVLSYVSQSAAIQSNHDVLQLYDRYIKTGSELAREKLHDLGVTTIPRFDQLKKMS